MGIKHVQRRHFNSLAKMRQTCIVHKLGRMGRGRVRFKGQLQRASK
jgi:hypothetical protein